MERLNRFNYTNREFESIRSELISLIQKFVPEWTDHNEADLGITILDLFAEASDVLHYYLDKEANEAYLDTCTEFENAILHASFLDYEVKNYLPSSVDLTFNITFGEPVFDFDIVIPEGFKCYTSLANNNYVFNNTENITIKAGELGASGTFFSGEYFTEEIGVSDGSSEQKFKLSNNDWLHDKLVIYSESPEGIKTYYDKVTTFAFSGVNDKHFKIKMTTLNTYILFSDGITGYIPENGYKIKAAYYRGYGINSNVPAGAITLMQSQFLHPDTNEVLPIEVLNSYAATGASSRETILSIKDNAPALFNSQYRNVTLEDYNSSSKAFMSGTYGGIRKAKTVIDLSYYSHKYNIYVLTSGINGEPVNCSQGLKDELLAYLEERKIAGDDISVLDPVLKPIDLNFSVNFFPNYNIEDVKTIINQTINTYFNFNNADFGKVIKLSEIYSFLNDVQGVNYVTLHTPNSNILLKGYEYPVKGDVIINTITD